MMLTRVVARLGIYPGEPGKGGGRVYSCRLSAGLSLTLWLRRGRFPLLSLSEGEHEKGIAPPLQGLKHLFLER